MSQKLALFWHRRDLRQHDNAGLTAALQSGLPVVPLFVYDTDILKHLPKQDARLTFIYDETERLARQTEAAGGTFLAYYGRPADVIRQLLGQFDIGALFTNEDYEPYATKRDGEIVEICQKAGVPFTLVKDQVIFAKDEILTKSGTTHKSFGPYRDTWLAALKPDSLRSYPSAELYTAERLAKLPDAPPRPTLESMGFERYEQFVPVAELPTESLVRDYHVSRDQLGLVNSSTRRSVNLRFGTLSVRELMRQAKELNEKLLAELVWRDYYMMLLWHYPNTAQESYNPRLRDVAFRNNEDEFQRWCEGRTGFPLVDAGMRELNQTGFLHNRARIATASFLVKHLLIDWTWGERYFGEKLLDYDLALNVGNWQWVAGTGVVAAPWFRVFSPDSQLEKYDPTREYVRRWVPEFGTKDYSAPMVDHKFARERAVQVYRAAYQAAV